jgi:hypothetical protein
MRHKRVRNIHFTNQFEVYWKKTWFHRENVYWKAVMARCVGKYKKLAVWWEISREVMRKWVTVSWTRDPTRKHEHNLYTGRKTWLVLCLLSYRERNTCSTSSKCKLITQDKEEKSAIISFWVISQVKMELVSNISETVSISSIGVLYAERQRRTSLHKQTVLSGHRDSGAKWKMRPCHQTLVMDMISGSCNSIFTRLVTRKYFTAFNSRETLKPNNELYGSKDIDDDNLAIIWFS